jgi:hypothetical protein
VKDGTFGCGRGLAGCCRCAECYHPLYGPNNWFSGFSFATEEETVMAKRGKILRDPHAGPGLLMVEGQQYSFSLEGVWKSEIPPKPGQVVEVEFDTAGAISSITVVSESQLAKEQAEAALAVAKEKGGKIFGQVVAKTGMANLIAGLLLLIGWFFLTTLAVEVPVIGGKLEYTFWQALGFIGSNNTLDIMSSNGHPSAGFYGFLALVALAGPFIQYFWKDKRATLGSVAPLVFMLLVWALVRSSLNSAFGGGGNDPEGLGRQMQEEAMKAISLGMGAYLSILVSLYFAGTGVKKFLATKAGGTFYEKPVKAA